MTAPLWTFAEVVAATGARLDNPSPTPYPHHAHDAGGRGNEIFGISIDTRSLQQGDLFVALTDARDGHEFTTTAFKAGAAAALVRHDYLRQTGDGTLLRVADPLRALEHLGRAARARLTPEARVIAVTGSVGKTTTKEMLRACLAPLGATHAADKSFNNHWGVPLTLARMPAGTRYGVFEIGMNHAGEITPLTGMVRPHVAIITTVEAVHIENFASVEGIAEAKAEIFAGLVPGGIAILPRDNAHYARLAERAAGQGAHLLSFGVDPTADLSLIAAEPGANATAVLATRAGADGPVRFALAAPGRHMALNALATALAIEAAGHSGPASLAALATFGAVAGRGSRHTLAQPGGTALLIDESYNANPASMRAALAVLGAVPRQQHPRRIAVLGDMLELGPQADQFHAELATAIEANAIDLVFACGPHMRHLYHALPAEKRATWAPASGEIEAALLAQVRHGDVIMIKGSNGSRMAPLVAALIRHSGLSKP